MVDETHFGARAEKYGAILKKERNAGTLHNDDKKDLEELEKADEKIKAINAKITIHLSGTPYRILMGSEFEKEDIISFCQFTDIVEAQKNGIMKIF
ncbi:MAG: hypothetical protein RSF40_11225 [Oscillospiraceae bacterium]